MMTIRWILLALVLATVLSWLIADIASPQAAKEGESHQADPAASGGSDDGTAGRVPAPPSAWGFVFWGSSGGRLQGQLRDTREECEDVLAGYREAQPDLLFSPCVMVRAERKTL